MRWVKRLGKRMHFKCSIALKRYNKHMGATDAFNKRLAATLMQMGRCKQRFQRAIFLGWLLPAVGVVNVNIAVSEILKRIWGPAHLTKLQGARGVHVLGFDKWFQQHLGEFVMRRGVEMATKAAQANGRTQPHFMPSKGRLHWELPLILPAPDRSIEDHGEPINVYKNRRAIIVARDGGGKATAWLGGGDKQATSRGWECELCKRRCIAKGLSRKRAKEAGELRRTQWACKLCKHFLCKSTCWHSWHDNRMCPSLAFMTPAPATRPAAAAPAPAASASSSPAGDGTSPPAFTLSGSRDERAKARSDMAPPSSKGTQQAPRRKTKSGGVVKPHGVKQRTAYACNRDAKKIARARETHAQGRASKAAKAAAMRAKKKNNKKAARSSHGRKRPLEDEEPESRSRRSRRM